MATRKTIALGCRPERQCGGGWRLALPVSFEHVVPEKETVVREEIVARRRIIEAVERHEATVRREVGQIALHGDIEATQRIVE